MAKRKKKQIVFKLLFVSKAAEKTYGADQSWTGVLEKSSSCYEAYSVANWRSKKILETK